MPREYQLKTSGYSLPHDTYMEVKYIIKGYHRTLRERNKIMYSSPYPDGQPRGSAISDTTANKAVRLAMLSSRVEAIDRAVHDINAEYGNRIKRDDVDGFDTLEAYEDYGTFCYYLHDPETMWEPSVRTWKRFNSMFAYFVAKNLNLI